MLGLAKRARPALDRSLDRYAFDMIGVYLKTNRCGYEDEVVAIFMREKSLSQVQAKALYARAIRQWAAAECTMNV